MEKIEIRNGYALFWGGWASNWYISNITIDGIKYNCVEQYMMNKKAEFFGDWISAKKIMDTPWPKSQKEIGRNVSPFIKEEWDMVKYDIILKATVEKYKQNEELKKALLETNDAKFVECSPYDDVWGIKLASSSIDATNPNKWRGLNLLGKAIDEARNIIKSL